MPREDGINKIEAHVAILCINGKGTERRVLIAKRTATRKLYPGLWECGGGQVSSNESFPDATRRQAREEFGIDIEVIAPICFYEISTPDGIIPGIRVLCRKTSDTPIRLDPREHTDFAWIKPEEVTNYPMIEGIAEAIEKIT